MGRRGLRRITFASGALLLALAAPMAANERAPVETPPQPTACAPVRPDPGGAFDLQELSYALCRRALGVESGKLDGPPSRLRVLLGGWLDVSYRDNDLASRSAPVDLDHLNLHLDIRLDDRWQAFFEGEYEHERDLTGFRDERNFELEQGWLSYAASDALQVRLGKFSLPFGYWTPVHWSVNVDTIEAPIHETGRTVPEQQLGGRLLGRVFPHVWRFLDPSIEYSLHLAYGDDGLGTGEANGLVGGADLRFWSGGRHLVGASYYAQENEDFGNREEHNVMLYGQATLPFDLLFRTEYLHQWRESRPGFTRQADIVYAKLRWDFHSKAYANYRFNFGDDDRYGVTAEHFVHTLTLGYRPMPKVITKLETAFHDLDHGIESYVSWGLSLGLLF